jgi:hypothetical protein
MELGLCLEDDSLFENPNDGTKDGTRRCPSECNLKICQPLWFYNDKLTTNDSKSSNDYMDVKFRADYAYHVGRYDEALLHYEHCQGCIKSIGTAMWRDIEEGRVRCLLRLGQLQEALIGAKEMTQVAQNVDQLTAALQLQLEVCHNLADVLEESRLLRKLISLHPHVARLWKRLGEVLEAVSQQWPASFILLAESDHSRTVTDTRFIKKNNVSCDQLTCDFRLLDGNCGHMTDSAEHHGSVEQVVLDSETSNCCIHHSARTSLGPDSNIGEVEKLELLSLPGATLHPDRQELTKSQSGDIRVLTCYMMARSLQQRVQKTVTSFAKQQNEQMQIELQKRIGHLTIPHNVSQACCKFVEKILNNYDTESEVVPGNGEISTEQQQHHRDLSRITDENEDITEAFDQRWFTWPHGSDL